MVPSSSAFCCPVLASAAGSPVAASAKARSARCAPSEADPAAASPARASCRAARSQSSAASAGPLSSRSAIGSSRLRRAAGKRPAAPCSSAALSWPVSARRAAAAATAWRAMLSSSAASHAGSAPPWASRRLRLDRAVSCAATSRAWPGSSAQTSRSRNRRRPDAPSPNRRSICGVSQTAARRAAMAACERGASPSRRKARRSGGPSGGDPVPSASPSANCAATPQARVPSGGVPLWRGRSASRAWRSPRPGTRREIASSRLVLPVPFGPVMTCSRAAGRQVSAG